MSENEGLFITFIAILAVVAAGALAFNAWLWSFG
jgi:hypothetical protein